MSPVLNRTIVNILIRSYRWLRSLLATAGLVLLCVLIWYPTFITSLALVLE